MWNAANMHSVHCFLVSDKYFYWHAMKECFHDEDLIKSVEIKPKFPCLLSQSYQENVKVPSGSGGDEESQRLN